jgi:PAS domain S-box-containing protein
MKDQSKTKQVLIQELTSLRQRVAILERSEKESRFLAENMADVAFRVDMNLKTTYVSPSVERILGYSPAERMSQTVDEQLTTQSSKLVLETLAVELEP